MTDGDDKFVSIVHILYQKEKNSADVVYLHQPVNGVWHEYNWQKIMDISRRLVTFFKAQGLKKGDRVTILSKNCAEWYITDFALMMAGLINVPIYATQNQEIINYILKETDVKLLFIGKLDAWESQKQGVPETIKIVNFPYDPTRQADFQWNEILANCSPDPDSPLPTPDDIFSIIYTSGTGGNPKGVVLTYANQYAASSSFIKFLRERAGLKNRLCMLSYLPLAHILERSIETLSCYMECDIWFVESLTTFADNLREVSPNVFVGVPRIWKVFKEKILEKIPQAKLDKLLKIPLISSLVKYKIKRALGLQNAFCLCGSAPLPISTLEWFEKIGIIIYEAYGSTEDFAGTVSNYIGHRKKGTVGLPLFGYEYKLGANDELLTRSAMNMQGYYLDPKKTAEVIDEHGFYHTGDIGKIDSEGYISVIGRLNETFKTDKGEFVIPVPIENRFHDIQQLSQLCLIGLNLRQPILITHLSEFAKNQSREKLRQDLMQALQQINESLRKWEQISHILITTADWTPENEMLTPTFKIKRQIISDNYYYFAEKLQKKADGVYWEDELD